MSATINDVAANLGLSVRAVRLRIDALNGTLSPYLRRGSNNQLIFTGEAVAILNQLEDLRKTKGINVKSAASIMRQRETERAEQDSVETLTVNRVERTASGEVSMEWVQRLLDEKDRTIKRLEVDNARLQERIDQLLPLALPSPRRSLLARLWPWSRKPLTSEYSERCQQ